MVFCPAVSLVSIDPEGADDRSARNALALAQDGLSLLLALEIASAGRPQIETELRALIRRMSIDNPLWGAPRIHGELLKLGFEVAQSSVAKYMIKRRGPPSQGWRIFLRNHAPEIAAMDLFVVPTIGFDLLYAFVIVRLDRRGIVWINVTTNPTAEWIARQLTEAFPWDEAPRYLVRDRDRILRSYACYYNDIRTHRSLDKDAPVSRPVQRTGIISSHTILGGLHHHYVRV
jgi:hypothetical protein